jgi:hypothetical protein
VCAALSVAMCAAYTSSPFVVARWVHQAHPTCCCWWLGLQALGVRRGMIFCACMHASACKPAVIPRTQAME